MAPDIFNSPVMREHVIEPESFVTRLRAAWSDAIKYSRFGTNGMRESGPFQFDPDSLKTRMSGNYKLYLNPMRSMGGLGPIVTSPTRDFRDLPDEAILFTTTLFGYNWLVATNQRIVCPGNILLIPDPRLDLEQRMTTNTLAAPILLARSQRSDDLKFVFNSTGGWASVRQMHFHGFFEHELWLIECAPTAQIAIKNGVVINLASGHPPSAIQFCCCDISNLANETIEFIDYLELRRITYNCLITRSGIYVFPRPERALHGSQLLQKRISAYELCGIPIIADEVVFASVTSEQLDSEITNASFSESEIRFLCYEYLSASSSVGDSPHLQSCGYTISDALIERPESVIEVDRDSDIPDGSVMVVRDGNGKIRILVDRANKERFNVRNVADLEELLPEFLKATERVPTYGYCSQRYFRFKLHSGWKLLPTLLQARLLGLFEQRIVPLTYRNGTRLMDIDVLMETNRSHNVAPGRSGLLLSSGKVVVITDELGEEFAITIKGCGAYDGKFETHLRRMMKGARGGKTIWKTLDCSRGFLVEECGNHENEVWESMRVEQANRMTSNPIPLFSVGFEIDGHFLCLLGRADPGNRRIGQFWKGSVVSIEERFVKARMLGRIAARMLLDRRPAIHTSLNLENIVDDGRSVNTYTDGESLVYLDSRRHAKALLSTSLETTLSRATTKYRELHSNDGPSNYAVYRTPFWGGFLQSFELDATAPEMLKIALCSLLDKDTSQDTLNVIVELLWEYFLPVRIVSARFIVGINPLRDFEHQRDSHLSHLPSIDNSKVWIVEEIELYRAAQRQMDRDGSNSYPDELRDFIMSTLMELLGVCPHSDEL